MVIVIDNKGALDIYRSQSFANVEDNDRTLALVYTEPVIGKQLILDIFTSANDNPRLREVA